MTVGERVDDLFVWPRNESPQAFWPGYGVLHVNIWEIHSAVESNWELAAMRRKDTAICTRMSFGLNGSATQYGEVGPHGY